MFHEFIVARNDLGRICRRARRMESGFHTLICDEDKPEHPVGRSPDRGRKPVPAYRMTNVKLCSPAAVCLTILAGVLLMVDIGLGVHYKYLKDTHLTAEDTESIGNELTTLQDICNAAIKSRKDFKQKLDSELTGQKHTKWELEHQTKRRSDYEANVAKITKDIAELTDQLPQKEHNCRLCPPGWHWMNSMCYFFPFARFLGYKSWQKAREFCQIHGGDLAVIDSKEKENSTVHYLGNKLDQFASVGFWIGLKDSEHTGTWNWLEGKMVAEGYWMDGEPKRSDEELCAAVYATDNFFKAWRALRCVERTLKWICEKAPNNQS